jgi:hypothetical protein
MGNQVLNTEGETVAGDGHEQTSQSRQEVVAALSDGSHNQNRHRRYNERLAQLACL